MSYCRFRNTVEDLEDCIDALHAEVSGEEHRARIKVIDLCLRAIEELGGRVTDDGAIMASAEGLPTND